MGRYDVVRTQLLGQDVVKVGRRAPPIDASDCMLMASLIRSSRGIDPCDDAPPVGGNGNALASGAPNECIRVRTIRKPFRSADDERNPRGASTAAQHAR